MFLRREDPTELRAATCSSPGILGEIQWRAERENDCGFGFGPAQKKPSCVILEKVWCHPTHLRYSFGMSSLSWDSQRSNTVQVG